ncbi:hypothetical protein ACOZFM_06955 [Streptomyces arboris]|uniref:hypothetical protein n=1 Tax=Streptomyces arboris TaxID=2600619 RepID=UPI003BF54D13
MATGLWGAGLEAWYGPGTPLVQRARSYRPDRRGQITLARWLRVCFLRGSAVVAAGVAIGVTLDSSLARGERALLGAVILASASFVWRCSLIRVVLRPGEIVRFGVWRHVVVPCSSVRRLHRESFRGGLVLETRAGEDVDFRWFDGSLWDAFYDFSAVCADAMSAHVRSAGTRRATPGTAGVERRFTWSIGADMMALGAVVCAVVGLVTG